MWKRLLIIFAVLVVVAVVLVSGYAHLQNRFYAEYRDVNHISRCFRTFINELGRMPESWDDIIANGYAETIEGTPEDLLVYGSPPTKANRLGNIVNNIDQYRIRFDMDWQEWVREYRKTDTFPEEIDPLFLPPENTFFTEGNIWTSGFSPYESETHQVLHTLWDRVFEK